MAQNKTYNASKVSHAWDKMLNPLRNLNSTQIEQMLELAKYGNDVKLQLAFWQIERTMPVFGVCLQKRIAGITSRKWDIQPVDQTEEAVAQANRVKRIFEVSDTRNNDGLTDALMHMEKA